MPASEPQGYYAKLAAEKARELNTPPPPPPPRSFAEKLKNKLFAFLFIGLVLVLVFGIIAIFGNAKVRMGRRNHGGYHRQR